MIKQVTVKMKLVKYSAFICHSLENSKSQEKCDCFQSKNWDRTNEWTKITKKKNERNYKEIS